MKRTSLTDNADYPEFCYNAAKHDEIFKNFRRYIVYRYIVECCSDEQGMNYLEVILNDYDFKITSEQWQNILLNDKLGNPMPCTYEFGNDALVCSPMTLRYTKVLCDIVKLFDVDSLRTVTEIGVGYGGQCRLLMNLLSIERYNLVDLPEAIALAERFLTELDTAGDIRYIDGTHLYNDLPCDLLISNYAFSELTKATQKFYIDRIISKSKAGYMTWNYSAIKSGGWREGYELEEILSMIPGAMTIPEVPLIMPGNCIIVWGLK